MVIAENELLGAANSIEAAAKKLAQLRPRPSAKVRGRVTCVCRIRSVSSIDQSLDLLCASFQI